MSLKAIKLILTIKCEESTRLVSESLDRTLPRSERWALRLHAMCCRSCRRYRHQIHLLREAISERSLEVGASLTPESRERIRLAITNPKKP